MNAPHPHSRGPFGSVLLGWAVLIGCLPWVVGCVEGRTSNHELEHVVPPHWPTGLADAALKIETRVAAIESQDASATQARAELLEIIGWLPEIAADTPLREAKWVPIHAACAKIEGLMHVSNDVGSAKADLQSLCEQLKELERELAEAEEALK